MQIENMTRRTAGLLFLLKIVGVIIGGAFVAITFNDDYKEAVAQHETYCEGVSKKWHPAYKPEIKCENQK
jgi:hypothetical protein